MAGAILSTFHTLSYCSSHQFRMVGSIIILILEMRK